MPDSLFPALDDPAAAEHIALSFPDRSLTYAQLAAAATGVAAALAGASRLAVLAEPRIETCVAAIGALQAGIPVVPLNPRSGSTELAHIASDAGPDAVALAPGGAVPDALSGCRQVVVALDGDLARPAPARRAEVLATGLAPEDPALIVYTSGTTGAPKGAVLPRRAIAFDLDALADAWAWTERDVVAHALPLFHVHGLVIGILGPVRRGGGALHLGRFSPEGVQGALETTATMLFAVPTMYRRLADAAEHSAELSTALGRARLLVSGSAALPASERKRLHRLTGRHIVERYGMTETLMITAQRADGDRAPGAVGPPLTGVEVRLVDDDRAEMPGSDGETIGEIEVRGPNLFLGYLNRPEATETSMHDGWFVTGDMATRGPDGSIRIVGRRATDLIKSGGFKIGAGEIESSLRDHPAVADAAVTGEGDPDLGERVVAWIVLRPDAHAAEQELIEHVAGQLAPHKRPRVVHFVADLPRNELGKVQKQRLSAG
jgi:malonyl-CoA/methylmalonyl-CoA synthetase